MDRRAFAVCLGACALWPGLARAQGAPCTRGALRRAREEFLALAADALRLPADERLHFVNVAINRRVQPRADDEVDDWATPCETLARHAGDCEDFAIAKFFVLACSGSAGGLRLLYARWHPVQTPAASLAHLVVLACEPWDDPWVLDSSNPLMVPLSLRDDLDPVFSFDRRAVWFGAGERRWHAGSERIRPWRGVLARDRLQ